MTPMNRDICPPDCLSCGVRLRPGDLLSVHVFFFLQHTFTEIWSIALSDCLKKREKKM